MKINAFLDANILFSLAYSEKSRLNEILSIKNVKFFVSDYVVAEAERNLGTTEQKNRLRKYLAKTNMVKDWQNTKIGKIEIREKDIPVTKGAAQCAAHFLITGDFRDFGKFFGKQICGFIVLPPTEFLKTKFE